MHSGQNMRYLTCMNKTAASLVFVSCVVLVQATLVRAQGPGTAPNTTKWPTRGWAKGAPASVGLDEKVLGAMDSDVASGKYPLVDSFAVFRCGIDVFERAYSHDYRSIYAKEAKTRGPLNAHLTGSYNYFDPAWHPYYHGTDLHTMQSVTKTVSSIIMGIAVTRGDFKAGLDTPLLKYFDVAKVKNVDERKRRITLRHVLTMSTGLDWKEDDVPYDDPKNDSSVMEATDDWVQYAIDRPMAQEPGKVFDYNSGVAELVAYVFQKETGQDIEKYGEKYLFQPLGMDHFWKRTPLGLPDTEGGLFLRTTDLAKIGYLYLQGGMWEGKQILLKDWVTQSVAPSIGVAEGWKYGFLWWLYQPTDVHGLIWEGSGFGGQELMVFPKEELIVVYTGWRVLDDPVKTRDLVSRILPAVRSQSCNVPY
jgi:CubicO group peptidase (beta-lactamase class C family)